MSLTRWTPNAVWKPGSPCLPAFIGLVVSGAMISRLQVIPVPGRGRAGRACRNVLQASCSVHFRKLAAQSLLRRLLCFLGIWPLDCFVDKRYPWRQTPDNYPGPLPKTIHCICSSTRKPLNTRFIWVNKILSTEMQMPQIESWAICHSDLSINLFNQIASLLTPRTLDWEAEMLLICKGS